MESNHREYSFEESLKFLDRLAVQMNDGDAMPFCETLTDETLPPEMVVQVGCTVMCIQVKLNMTVSEKVRDYAFHATMSQIMSILESAKTLRHLDIQGDGGLLALFDTPMKKDLGEIITLSAQVRSINDVVLKKFRLEPTGQIVTVGLDYGPVSTYCAGTSIEEYFYSGRTIRMAELLSKVKENNVNISKNIYNNLPDDIRTLLFAKQDAEDEVDYHSAPLINLRMQKWVTEQAEEKSMDLQLELFSKINLEDPFFDSLKAAYPDFEQWFAKKAAAGEQAYVFHNHSGAVKDFLYLKIETGVLSDVVPVLAAKKRLKVGTFKLLSRGTRRGERFMKKIMDRAMAEDVDEVYVTIFPTDELMYLIRLFQRFGFRHTADKPHDGGTAEWVLVKDMRAVTGDIMKDYPRMQTAGRRKWMLAIMPQWHTQLFPDSILNNESYDMVKDITPTNGIYKIYISWNQDCAQMKKGEQVVIYRTSDEPGRAWYRSVVTSVCTVDDVKRWSDFGGDEEAFMEYTKYSVFPEASLRQWFRTRRDMVVIKMLYNVAFSKRVIRRDLIEQVGLDGNARWTLLPLTDQQFKKMIELGQANERYIID